MRNLWFTGGSYADKVEVKSLWFELVSSGTSGVLTPPAGSSIVLDQWAAGVDALASQVDGGTPSYVSPFAADGSIITATLNTAGEWTLSGTPSAYPVAIVYVYKIALAKFDSSKSIGGIEVINNVNVGEAINASPEKTTPVDTDTMPLIDSAASNALKKVTWANIKATLKSYFDTLYTLANLGGIAHSLATAADDFLVASGSGTFVKKMAGAWSYRAALRLLPRMLGLSVCMRLMCWRLCFGVMGRGLCCANKV